MKTGMNNLQNRCKIYNFTLTVSLVMEMVSAVQNDRGPQLPAVRLIKVVVHNFCRKSSSVYLFNFC